MIAGMNLNYDWDDVDVVAIVSLINKGENILEIQKLTNRDMMEVMILIDSLMKENRISSHNHNLFGRRKQWKK